MRDSSADHSLVSDTLEAELIGSDDLSTLLGAELYYDAADPYAVTLVLTGPTEPVVWVFGRDLLLDGLGEPTGDGDVHVWPSLDSYGRAVVLLELCPPSGAALVQLRSVQPPASSTGRWRSSLPAASRTTSTPAVPQMSSGERLLSAASSWASSASRPVKPGTSAGSWRTGRRRGASSSRSRSRWAALSSAPGSMPSSSAS